MGVRDRAATTGWSGRSLPPLSSRGAVRLRRLVRRSFAEHGVEVAAACDHMVRADGERYGLSNLAALCAPLAGRAWPAVVEAHVAALLEVGEGLDDVDEPTLLSCTYCRVLSVETMTFHPGVATWDAAPGLVEVLCVDLPDKTLVPPRAQWERLGGLDRWRRVGRDNLRRLNDDPGLDLVLADAGTSGLRISFLTGDSYFTASLALLLPEVIARHDLFGDRGNGALVVLPSRHHLAWRVVDGRSAVSTLPHLVDHAVNRFRREPGPVSPHVFWVHDGQWEQLTQEDGDVMRVVVRPELAELLGFDRE